MDGVGPSASDLHSLDAAGELIRSEVGELVEGQGEGVFSLGVLLHVLLDQNLVVRVHLVHRNGKPHRYKRVTLPLHEQTR